MGGIPEHDRNDGRGNSAQRINLRLNPEIEIPGIETQTLETEAKSETLGLGIETQAPEPDVKNKTGIETQAQAERNQQEIEAEKAASETNDSEEQKAVAFEREVIKILIADGKTVVHKRVLTEKYRDMTGQEYINNLQGTDRTELDEMFSRHQYLWNQAEAGNIIENMTLEKLSSSIAEWTKKHHPFLHYSATKGNELEDISILDTPGSDYLETEYHIVISENTPPYRITKAGYDYALYLQELQLQNQGNEEKEQRLQNQGNQGNRKNQENEKETPQIHIKDKNPGVDFSLENPKAETEKSTESPESQESIKPKPRELPRPKPQSQEESIKPKPQEAPQLRIEDIPNIPGVDFSLDNPKAESKEGLKGSENSETSKNPKSSEASTIPKIPQNFDKEKEAKNAETTETEVKNETLDVQTKIPSIKTDTEIQKEPAPGIETEFPGVEITKSIAEIFRPPSDRTYFYGMGFHVKLLYAQDDNGNLFIGNGTVIIKTKERDVDVAAEQIHALLNADEQKRAVSMSLPAYSPQISEIVKGQADYEPEQPDYELDQSRSHTYRADEHEYTLYTDGAKYFSYDKNLLDVFSEHDKSLNVRNSQNYNHREHRLFVKNNNGETIGVIAARLVPEHLYADFAEIFPLDAPYKTQAERFEEGKKRFEERIKQAQEQEKQKEKEENVKPKPQRYSQLQEQEEKEEKPKPQRQEQEEKAKSPENPGNPHKPSNSEVLSPDTSTPQNFRITDNNLGEGGAKAKYAANISAIRILKILEAENRHATQSEQETLSRYVGWGGLPQIFREHSPRWAKEYAELKEILTPREYESAKASTLSAHYTSPTIIKAMYEKLSDLGLSELAEKSQVRILEPSMGVGNFFGLLPEEL
ncbi:MAG: hypothetical protein FWD01_04480, partial [Defluviitaleaceae bacterium]|nr:hypothetical protein [Defluviitaleaceae bacterium]